MRKITVSGKDEYEILIKSGILGSCGEHIRKVTSASRALIISDTNVFPIYGQTVVASLEQNGFKVASHIFPAGEASKNLATVEGMIKALCENELSRNDIVVALGGGVTGDMAGFASAIYLRGINFVGIPTTLLSQVDSSVGGKTGCDLTFGKNLIGAFHNPKLVLIDPETIKTLPTRYKNDGMGEIVKYALIKSEELYNTLLNCKNIDDILTDVIYTCVDIKRQVVENDFTEKGERMLLNFGHTLAHAIEKYENFCGLAHGEAVGVGMLCITKTSEKCGETEVGTAEKIEKLLNKFSLPTTFSGKTEELVNIMLYDKKRRGDSINLVLCEKVGKSYVKPFPISKLGSFFVEGK
ncbi:MAG: 3-dehydroquinate synthase [Clostridia bacterium]|nr:3-dehydroquinate synthase [Clostridia bacterium]